jgi:hypothetical protein
MKKNSLCLMTMSFLLFSCSESGGGGSTPPAKHSENLELEMNGIYQAKLKSINSRFSDHLGGSLTLVRDKDDFIADVRLSGGPKTTLHSQSIHIGERCPDARDDLNLDGIIDGEEGAQIYKDMLIPLDDDLSSQWMGLGIYPVTDDYGFYFWSRNVSFEKMMKDLRDDDINPTDEIAKIGANKTFQASGKVVIIRGIPTTEILPDSVVGRGRQSPHEAMPVACGVITKINSAPGVIDRDQTGIPVPADGQTLGGSGGADDGAIFTTGTTTGDTGNYGEEDDDVEVRGNNTEFGTTGGQPSGGAPN